MPLRPDSHCDTSPADRDRVRERVTERDDTFLLGLGPCLTAQQLNTSFGRTDLWLAASASSRCIASNRERPVSFIMYVKGNRS
jgi:hypothetical protein